MRIQAVKLSILLSILFLSACGGGGSSSSTNPATDDTTTSEFIDVDFATALKKQSINSSNLNEFIQLSESYNQ